ncbi:MAG TPA: NUDIX domain-containing protein [Allosphingosinicella sp.]|jgi:ADP-ribose pyrophosphatase YjhB (NUDIX family)
MSWRRYKRAAANRQPVRAAALLRYAAAMNIPLQIAYRVRRFVFRVLRVRTRGVKAMVFNGAGELLLIRNSYGPTHLFVLPGGGIGRRESPEAAAAREVKEETGLEVRDVVFVGCHANTSEGKRDTIHLFTARADGEPNADAMEVAEARFFPLDALPDNVSLATLRRLAELRGERPGGGRW